MGEDGIAIKQLDFAVSGEQLFLNHLGQGRFACTW
jgi:hypothetical protein